VKQAAVIILNMCTFRVQLWVTLSHNEDIICSWYRNNETLKCLPKVLLSHSWCIWRLQRMKTQSCV